MIKVILKDGSTMEIEEGTSILEVAKRISEGLARNVTCGEINGEIRDIRYKIKEDCNLILHTFKNDDLEGKKSLLAYNVTYYGTSCKKIISKC